MPAPSTPNFEDIDGFLEALGLGQLSAVFRANDIDIDVLPELQDADLRELGLSLGHRKKILVALEALRTPRAPMAGPPPQEPGAFESRRISVLFCDMVGSTTIAHRLTPDQHAEVIQFYYRIASRVIRRFDGYIATLQGDGIAVVFGYPAATGAHAERAIAAGLAMIEAYSSEEYRLADGQAVAIRARVGIASGRTIVGVGDANVSRNEVYMFGSTPSKAARIQSHAAPETVVVDDETRAQAGDHFGFERLADASLKGFDETVPLSRVLGRQRPDASPDAAPSGPEAPLIGRETERAALADAWEAAKAGRASLTILAGEPGLGKSHLLRTIDTAAKEDGARRLRLACGPLFSSLILHPVIGALERIVGRSDEAASPARLDALRRELLDPPDADLARVAQLIGLPIDGATGEDGGAEARAALLATLAGWLLGQAERPTLVTVEDAHWADPTTCELLQRAADQLAGRRIAFVVTTRNQPEPLWQGHLALRTVELRPLPEDQAAILLLQALGDRSLPEAIRERVLEHSGGNPLMLQELAKGSEQWGEGALGADVDVPTSIYDSIAGRLDQLTASRGVANLLAVFGMEVRAEVLSAALGLPAAELAHRLADLREASILDEAVAGVANIVRFRHMLYRDVVYERLVADSRTKLHRKAADTLLAIDPEIAERQPGILAWHFYCAQDYAAAAPLALSAGEGAAQRSALIEASHFLDQALSTIERLGDDVANQRLQLRALTAMAAVKRARFGIASDEVGALSNRVQQIALAVGDTNTALLALNGLYTHALVKADYPQADHWARALIEAARNAGDATFEMIGMRAAGGVALHTGRFDNAADLLQAALARYDVARHLPLAHAHGYDHAEICAVFLSFALWMRGDLQGARRLSAFSVSHSREIAHAHSLAQALAFRAMLGILARDVEELAAAGVEAKEVGDRHGLKVMAGAGSFFRQASILVTADAAPTEADIAAILQKREVFLSVNPYNYGCLAEGAVAEGFMRFGDLVRAEHHLGLALAVETRTGEIWTRAERLRLSAKLFALRGEAAAAEDALQAAYDVAVGMGARTIALRIACDMGDLQSSPAASARVAEAQARMISLDGGWDELRLRRVVAVA